MKDTVKGFFRFYENQTSEAKILIILLTTFASTCFVALAVNIWYYGL